jgi:aminoglycoside phosphotransferase (APT) family kinase protein
MTDVSSGAARQTGSAPGHEAAPIVSERTAAWLAVSVPEAQPPFALATIEGGHSNLTYLVTDARGVRWVLRRPPMGELLSSAHDMHREFSILRALSTTAVPVPPAVALCRDQSVTGADFYLMEFVEGHVLRDAGDALAVLDEEARRSAGLALADVLAEIHSVDVDRAGLGGLGRRGGYVSRQLRRWQEQFQASNQATGRRVPLVTKVHNELVRRSPAQASATLVHGDYRLDNCLLDSSGAVRAVLDWELCTIGDPLADLGALLIYWTEPGDPYSALASAPTAVPGFPSREEMIARYAERRAVDLSQIDFYVAFAYWRLACILEGVYSRYVTGGKTAPEGYEDFNQRVQLLARLADERLSSRG